jgi:hypothetical protein
MKEVAVAIPTVSEAFALSGRVIDEYGEQVVGYTVISGSGVYSTENAGLDSKIPVHGC